MFEIYPCLFHLDDLVEVGRGHRARLGRVAGIVVGGSGQLLLLLQVLDGSGQLLFRPRVLLVGGLGHLPLVVLTGAVQRYGGLVVPGEVHQLQDAGATTIWTDEDVNN